MNKKRLVIIGAIILVGTLVINKELDVSAEENRFNTKEVASLGEREVQGIPKELADEIRGLYKDSSYNELVNSVTQQQLVKLFQEMSQYRSCYDYKDFQPLVTRAMHLLTNPIGSLKDISEEVNQLFADDAYNVLKNEIKKEDIDKISSKVKMIYYDSDRKPFEPLLARALQLLTTGSPGSVTEVTKQVHDLFSDESFTQLRETVTSTQLDLACGHARKLYKLEDRNKLVPLVEKAVAFYSERVQSQVINLFSDNTFQKLKDNIKLKDIDTASSQVESLDHEEIKNDVPDGLLSDLRTKINTAKLLFRVNQYTQTINLGGQGIGGYSDHSHDSGFARVSLVIKNHKISLVKKSDYQFHWAGWKTSKYASIKLIDPNNKVIYDQSWNGNQSVKGNGYQKFDTFAQYDLPEGSTVEIYHAEGSHHRFSTSDDDELKTKLGKTGCIYTYRMQNNKLVLESVGDKPIKK